MKTTSARRKPIIEIALELMAKEGIDTLGWGDVGYLDMIADAATHTKLMDVFPTERHHLILNALGRSGLFIKTMNRYPGGKGLHRRFFLKPTA